MTQQSDHFSRHAGFELLRIISMMMIVLMHGIGHGGLGTTAAPGTFPYFIYWLLFMLGRVSTNCFVMLTGYFMWQSRTKASRLFRIEIQVLFYSLLTFVIGLFAGSVSLSAGNLLRAVFPVTSCVYWFCSCYFSYSAYGRRSASGPTRHGWKTAIVMYGFSFFILPPHTFPSIRSDCPQPPVCSFMLSFPCSLS